MPTLLERARAGEVLLVEGAMGTFLQARGLGAGDCPEAWCLDRPEVVREIHAAYRDAGADIAETNTFGANRIKLAHYGLADRAAQINRAAARLAREAVGPEGCVLGSAGPTGQFLAPLGTATESQFAQAFREQVTSLAAGGADAVIVETMAAAEEAAVAVRAAREHTDLVVVASFAFAPRQDGGYATMMGLTPQAAAQAMIEAGAHILGANCGVGMEGITEIVRALRAAAPEALILGMPNAGMPEVRGGETVFPATPEQMAAGVPALVEAGANLIGGCCGTGPEHIRAMKAALAR